MGCEGKCVPKESGSLTGKTGSLSCDGYVLAWESPANKVGSLHKSEGISEANGAPNVVMPWYIRPMSSEYLLAMLVNFHLAYALMPSEF